MDSSQLKATYNMLLKSLSSQKGKEDLQCCNKANGD